MLDNVLKEVGVKLGLGDKLAQLAPLVMQQINTKGGLAGLLQGFQAQGAGDQAASWVSTDANQPVTAEQTEAVLGSDFVQEAAAKLGMEPSQVSLAASEMIPGVVDKMTPEGTIPENHDFMGHVKGMLDGMDMGQIGGMLGGMLGGDNQ